MFLDRKTIGVIETYLRENYTQGVPALMKLQSEESSSIMTPPKSTTTSLKFKGYTTSVVPFIKIMGEDGIVYQLPQGSMHTL